MNFKEISECRVCKSPKMSSILSLGQQVLTGVFLKPGELESRTPVEIMKCDNCHLVQLKHTYDLSQLYGDSYGYRSGLNQSMVQHLRSIVEDAVKYVPLSSGDRVIDIASNDGTLLSHYLTLGIDLELIGIDPTADRFRGYYPPGIDIFPEFFGSEDLTKRLSDKRAKIITSIACFYDLEEPVVFAKQIAECLDINGVWILEQAYLPLTIETNDIQCFCQEHSEFYALTQIEYILNLAGLTAFDVEFNSINGGSFRVYACHQLSSAHRTRTEKLSPVYEAEKILELKETYDNFVVSLTEEGNKVVDFLKDQRSQGKVIAMLGASTKVNVYLQYFNIDSSIISFAGEVNSDKFGKLTPGSHIPIISEAAMFDLKPDILFVGPWHFKTNLLNKPEVRKFQGSGGKVVFPLPTLTIL